MDQAFHHGRPVKEIDALLWDLSEQSEVQSVADRPMRRSALEEERRNSRHMNLELSMRADALRFGGVDKNAAKTVGHDGMHANQNQTTPHKAGW